MKKYFVSFEVAKKLKKIGFNEEVIAHYNKDGNLVFDKCGPWHHNSGEVETSYFSAPLHEQVIEWLIQNHDIGIEVSTEFLGRVIPVKCFKTEIRKEAFDYSILEASEIVLNRQTNQPHKLKP